MNSIDRITELISNGIEAYRKSVIEMPDRDLYMHCYNGDEMECDFCFEELKRRGIDQFRNCHACQGAGCPVCNGQGKIPTFE